MLEINFHTFPIIKTNRLLLRRVTNADAQQIFAIRTDARVHQYLDLRIEETIDQTLNLINRINNSFDSNEGLSWAITIDGTDTLIGTFGFWRIMKEHHRAEIGYTLHPDFWGKGIMNEVAKAALRYGFEELKFHSIEANIHPANIRSKNLLLRLGFEREGYFKENYFYNGQFLDSEIYSLLNKG